MIQGHGGNVYELADRLGCLPSEIVDMSSNMNPLGPPPGLIAYLTEGMDRIHALPEADAGTSVEAFAGHCGITPERVLAGNGTTQFIYSLPQALETRRALIVGPTYADYADACTMHRVAFEYFFSHKSTNFVPDLKAVGDCLNGVDTVFVCNPNNPTGTLISTDDLKALCGSYPNVRFIVDESYLPFVSGGTDRSLISSGLSNVVVLSSLSKIYRIPGLRLGFLTASEEIVRKLTRYALPWNVNSLSQAAVEHVMKNEKGIDVFVEDTQNFLDSERQYVTEIFHGKSDITFFPSTTSFILAELSENHTAEAVCGYLADNRVLIRNCSNFAGLSNRYVRLSLKTRETNRQVARMLLRFLESLQLP